MSKNIGVKNDLRMGQLLVTQPEAAYHYWSECVEAEGGGVGSRKSIVTRDREGERVREWEEERGVERGGHIERERGESEDRV